MNKLVFLVSFFILTCSAEAVSVRNGSFVSSDTSVTWDNRFITGISIPAYTSMNKETRIDINYDLCTANMEDTDISATASLAKHLLYATLKLKLIADSMITPYLKYDLGIEKSYVSASTDIPYIIEDPPFGIINGLTYGLDITISETISFGLGFNVYYIGDEVLNTQFFSFSIVL